MRLRPPIAFDRRTLKPAIGDVVLFEGTRYIVTQIGSRYVKMHKESDTTRKAPYMAPFQQITKVMPETKDLPSEPPTPPTIIK